MNLHAVSGIGKEKRKNREREVSWLVMIQYYYWLPNVSGPLARENTKGKW
jgi:hypothetical protein